MSNIPTASQPTAAMRTGQNMRDGSPSWFITTPTVASAHLMPDYSSVPFISHVPRHHQQITQRHSGDNFNPAPIQANSGTGEIHATAASAPAVPSGTHSHQYLFPNVPTATFGTSIHHGNYTAYTEHRMHAIPFLGQDQVEHANDPSYDYVSQLPPHLRYP
ncbi:hypothetical protein APHAL10511_001785 [Amanita phalloides]|nr:hypothetical protein APHAL10511_001785 [Amanita phalloides]